MEPVRDDAGTKPAPQASQAGASSDYLVFEIDGCRYALPVDTVREVLPALEVDRLPGESAELLGVINLRGRMVPVADSRRLLGAAPRPIRARDHFLVTEYDERILVVPCDRVLGMETLLQDDDEATYELVRVGARVARVVHDEHGLVLVPDLTTCLEAA